MSSRRPSKFSDVLRSVAVLAALMLSLVVVGKIFTIDPDHAGSDVDPAAVAAQTARQVGVPLWAPPSLPNGWRATAATWRDDAWHVGVVTGGEKYIGLEQTSSSVTDALRRFSPHSRDDGSTRIGGAVWSRRAESDGDTVYVRRAGKATLVVLGSAPQTQIERYIASLSPVS